MFRTQLNPGPNPALTTLITEELAQAIARAVMAGFSSSSSGYSTDHCWVLDSRLARPWVSSTSHCLQTTNPSLPAHHCNWRAGRRYRATTYQVCGCQQQLLVITDLRSCPWASGDRFSKAVPLVWEKQLVKEFPESELLSLLASLGFPDEKAWPKPSWTRLLFSWLSFDLDELV